MQLCMQDGKDDLTRGETTTRYPSSFEERDLTPLWGNVVSLGKMIVYNRISLEQ